jgi:hypothetical protein
VHAHIHDVPDAAITEDLSGVSPKCVLGHTYCARKCRDATLTITQTAASSPCHSHGRLRAQTTELVSVDARHAPSAQVPKLSVHQAFSFCAQRLHLQGLPYGVDVRGYLVRWDKWGGAGPVPTILLDKPRPVNWTKRPLVAAGKGIEFGTMGGPPSNRWVTIRGSLLCDRGSVIGYALGIFNG